MIGQRPVKMPVVRAARRVLHGHAIAAIRVTRDRTVDAQLAGRGSSPLPLQVVRAFDPVGR